MDNKQLLIYGGVSIVSAGAGFGAGYLVFKKKFQKIADEEIESVRQAYAKSAQPKPNLSDIRRDVEEVVATVTSDTIITDEGYSYKTDVQDGDIDADMFRSIYGRVPTDEELIVLSAKIEPGINIRSQQDHDDYNLRDGNIFEHPQEDPQDEGVDAEVSRSAVRPYIISSEEWHLNETNYDQIPLTYWADDDVLADDAKRLVVDVEAVVGATNLHRFGTLSNDPDLVYVRNDAFKADYEITKDERNYGEVVHGVDPDARSSNLPRRMRGNDE